MSHSGFDFTNLKNADKATGYAGDLTMPVGNRGFVRILCCRRLYTTVGDLYKWDRALYSDQVVSQALLQKAFTAYQSSYGYGWGITESYGKKTVQHAGGITGFASNILRVPGDQICIIVFTNVASDAPSKISNEINGMFNGKTVDCLLQEKKLLLIRKR